MVDIEKLKKRRNVGGLIKALKDEDLDIRRGAALALSKIKDVDALPALIAALESGSESVSAAAAWALGNIRSLDAGAALSRFIKRTAEGKARDQAEIACRRINVIGLEAHRNDPRFKATWTALKEAGYDCPKLCFDCGMKIPVAEAIFCPGCGARLD